jgi:hypothetical protein
MHLYLHQEEDVKALSREPIVDLDAQSHRLSPDSDQLYVRPWAYHRLYPAAPLPTNEDCVASSSVQTTKVLLSGQTTAEPFQLDVLFLENWHKYLENILMNDKRIDLVQARCVSINFLTRRIRLKLLTRVDV